MERLCTVRVTSFPAAHSGKGARAQYPNTGQMLKALAVRKAKNIAMWKQTHRNVQVCTENQCH